MTIVLISSLLAIIALGIITTYSDITKHKAYNKHLIIFGCIGLVIQCVSIVIAQYSIWSVMLNLILAFFMAFVLFAIGAWAAGDAKLFFVMLLLLPWSLYGQEPITIFPAFLVLGFIFSIALCYVVAESIVFFVRDIRNERTYNWHNFLPRLSLEVFLTYGVFLLASNTFNGLWYYFVNPYFSKFSTLRPIISILFVTALYSFFHSKKSKCLLLVACVGIRVLLHKLLLMSIPMFSMSSILIIIAISIIKAFTSHYNYQRIATSSIREGQILAKQSLVFMIPSTVKGLPKWTDESTRCRLDATEVAAIKRWETSKYGQSEIVIVRHIPFAPFIFSGVILHILFILFLGV